MTHKDKKHLQMTVKDCTYRIDFIPASDLSQLIMLNFVNLLFFFNI